MAGAHQGNRWLGHLRSGVIGAFVLSLFCGILLPVYTDEAGWRFGERAGFDGVDKLFADQCGPNTLAVPPGFMMPARWYSAFFNGDFADPLYVRLSGILYALIWTGLVLALAWRVVPAAARSAVTTIGIALMGLGTLPLLLVWSRPEQPIILAVTAALLIAAPGWQGDAAPAGKVWLRAFGVLACAIVAFSYHFKALMVVPVFAACILYCGRGRTAHLPRLLAGALLLWATVATAHYWFGRLACPADPIIAAKNAHHSLGLMLLATSGGIGSAVWALLSNYRLVDYVRFAAPAVHPMSWWLPWGQIGPVAQDGWRTGIITAWSVAALAGLAALVIAAWQSLRARKAEPRLIFALALFGAASAWCVSQRIRNVYEASFVLPLVMLALIFALAGAQDTPWLRRLTAGLAMVLAPLTLASEGFVAATYGPALWSAAGQSGYLPAQPYSVATFGYRAARRDILAAARACHIPTDARAQAVLLDELTYYTMMHTRLPQHHMGVLDLHWRGTIRDPVSYLKSRGSAGILLGCQWLPADLRARAHREGAICCLGPPGW